MILGGKLCSIYAFFGGIVFTFLFDAAGSLGLTDLQSLIIGIVQTLNPMFCLP